MHAIEKEPWVHCEHELKSSGDFKLGRRLGTGSNCVVFRAEFKGQSVAAKALLLLRDPASYGLEEPQDIQTLFAPGAVLGDLLRELRTHSSLPPHPHICEFLGVVKSSTCGDIEGVPVPKYVLLSLATEGTLEDKLKECLDSSQAHEWIRQVAEGVAFLHSQVPCILHRDLKPANVLIHEGVAKIADFGFARPLDRTKASTRGVGTLSYMAPEILAQQPYDAAADVYSLAVLAFEALRFPLPLGNVAARLRVAAETEHPVLQKLFAAGALAENPQQRPTAQRIVDLFIKAELESMKAENTTLKTKSHELQLELALLKAERDSAKEEQDKTAKQMSDLQAELDLATIEISNMRADKEESKTSGPALSLGEAVAKIDLSIQGLETKIVKCELEIRNELSRVSTDELDEAKSRARQVMKCKKMYGEQRDQRIDSKFSIEDIIIHEDHFEITRAAVQGMQIATVQLKIAQGRLSIDRIEDLMADIQDTAEDFKLLNEAILAQTTLAWVDDSELQEEFALLVEEAATEQLVVGATATPVGGYPTAVPGKAASAVAAPTDAAKSRAMHLLKRKKMYEQRRDRLLGIQFSVANLSFQLEQAEVTKAAVEAMEKGAAQLKAARGQLSIDKNLIEELQDDMQEIAEALKATDAVLHKPELVGFDDQDESEDAVQAMEKGAAELKAAQSQLPIDREDLMADMQEFKDDKQETAEGAKITEQEFRQPELAEAGTTTPAGGNPTAVSGNATSSVASPSEGELDAELAMPLVCQRASYSQQAQEDMEMHTVSKEEPKPSALARNLLETSAKIDLSIQDLETKIGTCEQEIGEQVAKVSTNPQARSRAMQTMKRKKMNEQWRDLLMNIQLNVEGLIIRLEQIEITTAAVQAMEAGQAQFKVAQGQLSLDRIEELMDDIQAIADEFAEINEAFSRPVGLLDDDDDLMAELARLEEDEGIAALGVAPPAVAQMDAEHARVQTQFPTSMLVAAASAPMAS